MVFESKPICPFVGRECISCGVTQQAMRTGILHPCAFWDEYASDPVEPCLIKRAVNKVLKIPDCADKTETKVEVPY